MKTDFAGAWFSSSQEDEGVLGVENWAEIRRRYRSEGMPITAGAPPLELGLGRSDSVTSAHVIEAVLHHSPAVRRDVERLSRARNPGPRMTSSTGSRL